MTWPNTSLSTTALDQSTDDPELARPTLRTAVEQINSMRDTFSISDPTTGDLLVWTGSVWQNQAEATAEGYLIKSAVIRYTSTNTSSLWRATEQNPTLASYRCDPTEISDPNGIVEVSTGSFTLGSGTWLIANNEWRLPGAYSTQDYYLGARPILWWHNVAAPVSSSTIIKSFESHETSGSRGGFFSPDFYLVRTITGSETFSLWGELYYNGYAFPAIKVYKLQ